MDSVLAGKLIERISNFTDYNVNIMDENGILVASRMKERIGSFHEVAFDIINGTNDTVMVDMDNPETGVKAGVNMAIYTNKKKVGVVGVTGSPDMVLSVAKIIKMSVEVMMEYEMYKYESMKKYNLREQLMHLIFYNDNFEREDLSKYFKALNLDEEILRIPILIQIENSEAYMTKVKEILDGNKFRSRQDIGDTTKEDFIFLFKGIDCDIRNVMQDYKYLVGEYLSPLLQYIRARHLIYNIYVGPIQNDIMYYRQAYLDCMWMQKNMGNSENGSFYFYDYMIRYMESRVPVSEFNAIFYMLKKELGKKFTDNYTETIEALIEKDYNLAKAGNMLHIHKNTLVYRLDKIREVLNMNPLVNNTEREFMECFYYYLIRK
ncbi:hypothetical protein BLA28_30665 [Eisenbergiella tayi]|uniref:Carbohydrate diacid regulator n=1 Tax=Eisenbergiella tayi TaxID=1432052 RepID=A0A1E3AVR2_9FIRM|nr:sugar diacid recognition domain-containing protein [Eisenbergiella tayi]ODM12803.1 Carbohydrate diacid regulator [Eisenbergiella tayi]OIZ59851.1 hypothetical protein BLA28_30665 [Eisenbergiella tayi]